LCDVFGEAITAGQRCRLPKIRSPKPLSKNDIVNVVCGSETPEEVYNPQTLCNGIDMEFDGISDLFICIRFHRTAYIGVKSDTEAIDPLLSSLISQHNPYQQHIGQIGSELETSRQGNPQVTHIAEESEFEYDGCIFRVTKTNRERDGCINAKCIYPRGTDNLWYDTERTFDIELVKDLIAERLDEF
jgi:hypothetical protein